MKSIIKQFSLLFVLNYIAKNISILNLLNLNIVKRIWKKWKLCPWTLLRWSLYILAEILLPSKIYYELNAHNSIVWKLQYLIIRVSHRLNYLFISAALNNDKLLNFKQCPRKQLLPQKLNRLKFTLRPRKFTVMAKSSLEIMLLINGLRIVEGQVRN